MRERKRTKIDLEELTQAFDDGSYEHRYFLDLEEGELLFLSEYVDSDEQEELRERIEDEPGRYEEVPMASSANGYLDMEEFIATVDDPRLAGSLYGAIRGRGAFRRFKNVLLDYPKWQERWFRFKDARLRQRALDWLEEIGIIPDS